MFQIPCMGMWDINRRAEARLDRRVDIRSRAVADHHGARWIELGLRQQPPIGRDILFERDPNAGEEVTQSRSFKLVHLLRGLSFGEQKEPMTTRKFG